MKVAILTVLLLIETTCNAQLGIITMSKKTPLYFGQWFVIEGKGFRDKLMYYDEIEKVDSLLLVILEPCEFNLDDGKLDESGDLFWVVDNENGFNSCVYRVLMDDKYAQIVIVTALNE